MANPFSFFRQKINPSYVAVDIGTTSIKLVEVGKGDTLPRLVNYGILESQGSLARANAVLQSSTAKLFDDDVTEFLKALLGKVKPKTTAALASLPPFSAFTTILSVPDMAPADLEKTISYQARQYIPLPISEVALDWSKVGEYEDEKGFKQQQILLISVPQEQIRKYQNIFKKAGLDLQVLEVESVSLVRSLIGTDPTPSFLIDVGSRSTSILVAENGKLKFSGQTDFSGASLTQALASSSGINPLRAEELKKERGIVGTGANYELSTIMLPFLDAIISEVKRTEFSYRGQFPNAPKIERAILTGGGSNLMGIQKYFEGQLGMPVVRATPLVRFSRPPVLEPLVPELNGRFGVSLGLALREFTK